MQTIGKKSYSLYFHIPFCTKKCHYCHFFVLPNQPDLHERFVQALKKEWFLRSPKTEGLDLESIYFGGGTPALLHPGKFQEILRLLPLHNEIEISLEANPENLSLEHLRHLRSIGINRLSIGAQTFDDELLKLLGRTHDAKKTILGIENAFKAGFENISIDLMYDLPRQTAKSWQKTLKIGGSLPIQHVSLYNLTIEPHTPFFKRKKTLEPDLPSAELSLAMYQEANGYLEEKGFKAYEISAFAKPGYQSHHNTGYWTARPFFGLGPSAYSFWNNIRFRNISHFNQYTLALDDSRFPVDLIDELPKESRQRELFAVEIRLKRGIHLPSFEDTHGPLSHELLQSVEILKQSGWIKSAENTLFLTPEGVLFYDSVATELIAEADDLN